MLVVRGTIRASARSAWNWSTLTTIAGRRLTADPSENRTLTKKTSPRLKGVENGVVVIVPKSSEYRVLAGLDTCSLLNGGVGSRRDETFHPRDIGEHFDLIVG